MMSERLNRVLDDAFARVEKDIAGLSKEAALQFLRGYCFAICEYFRSTMPGNLSPVEQERFMANMRSHVYTEALGLDRAAADALLLSAMDATTPAMTEKITLITREECQTGGEVSVHDIMEARNLALIGGLMDPRDETDPLVSRIRNLSSKKGPAEGERPEPFKPIGPAGFGC